MVNKKDTKINQKNLKHAAGGTGVYLSTSQALEILQRVPVQLDLEATKANEPAYIHAYSYILTHEYGNTYGDIQWKKNMNQLMHDTAYFDYHA